MFIFLGALLIAFVLFFLSTYKVIEPNEAHVITFMGGGRKTYCPKDVIEKEKNDNGEVSRTIIHRKKTAYFYIPFLMKRMILPLTNVKMEISDIHLNDMQVAPFICDVITWINIENPIIASERLTEGANKFQSLKEDLVNIVQAVARTTSMKQEILDILRDRETFSTAVFKEVEPLLEEWGVRLVNLEVNDIRDDESKSSNVIKDYESIRKSEINSLSRQKTSEMEKKAIVVEQLNAKESAIATAEAQEKSQLADIAREESVQISNQKKEMSIAKAAELANFQKIEAHRTLEVGKAKVSKESAIETANGEAEAIRIKGEKESDVIKLKGIAEGSAIEAKGLAEATAKDAMAEALKKFNDAGISLEKLKAFIEVQTAKWKAYGMVAEKANIKIVNSGKGADLFGIPMNAETGADLGQMLDGLDISKLDLNKIKDVVKQSEKTEDIPF